MSAVAKLWRYTGIYGWRRTVYKAVGRRRSGFAARLLSPQPRSPRDVGVIGCGQFAFSTIGCILTSRLGNRFGGCFDTDADAAASFARFYRIRRPADTARRLMQEPSIATVYIASNHASHADYAIDALSLGKQVYVEKPVATSSEQLARLLSAADGRQEHLFVGYNRPFSKAVRTLKAFAEPDAGPLTFSCFVSGHLLGPDHWYRRTGEGTRICGNAGHWLDLLVHLLCWGELPDCWSITLIWSDDRARDDNVAIVLTSERGDLANIVLSARAEPFEGINESIDLQWGSLIAKIDDFRRMQVWKSAFARSFRFPRKDVGHEAAIMQPFCTDGRRPWEEVVLSSLLTLKVAGMVKRREQFSEFCFSKEKERLSRVGNSELHAGN